MNGHLWKRVRQPVWNADHRAPAFDVWKVMYLGGGLV